MGKKRTQEERLDYLVEAFKEDSGEYKDLKTPADTNGKRRILRSLMNIRMPRKIAPAVLEVQDEYLQNRIRENRSSVQFQYQMAVHFRMHPDRSGHRGRDHPDFRQPRPGVQAG